MSLPAADLPAPIAVLVLAWDEATPAVRALVEATQAPAPTVDSILVMVPQADAPDHLSAEEYLPLPADAVTAIVASPAPEAKSLVAQEATKPAKVAAAPLAPGEPAKPLEPEESGTDTDVALPAFGVEPDPSQVPPGPSKTTPPLPWAAVRVLRLASHNLPQLAQRAGRPLPAPLWLGPAQWPAEPYLGATSLASAPHAASPAPEVVAFDSARLGNAEKPAHSSTLETVPMPLAPALTQVSTATSAAAEAAPSAPLYEPAEAMPQGALEIDLPLVQSEANELEEAPSRDLFQEADFSPNPAQAGWSGALAALRQPAPLAPPTTAVPVSTPPATLTEPAFNSVSESVSSLAPSSALQPAATQYPAPDLNYQVIQYARFAVPVALAEANFAAIYAPAWPTWLAAQELRQRSGRPLVLHVASLAAGAEPAGTATGWMAELQRQALLRADLVLTETPALAERLRHELRLPFSAVLTVPAADAAGIAQALHTARPRPVA